MPARSIAVIWTNTSFFPPSGAIKPKPLVALIAQLRERVKEHLTEEQELVVDPAFFTAFALTMGEVGRVHVTPKRGRAINELTKYRYDAILEIGSVPEGEPLTWLDWEEDELSLPLLRQLLNETRPEMLGVRRVPNARTADDVRAAKRLSGDDPREGDAPGVNPEEIWGLAEELT